MTQTVKATFYYDVSDELVVAKFPEDFADWLRDEGRDADAREFMARWHDIESTTPWSDLKFDQVVDLASVYANVVEFGDELRTPSRKTYDQLFNLLRDMEASDEPESDDEPMTWDREAALVNRAIADMPSLLPEPEEDEIEIEPTYHDVTIYVAYRTPLHVLTLNVMKALWNNGYQSAVDDLLLDLKYLFRDTAPVTDGDVFLSLCEYINILPEEDEPDDYIWRP